MNEENPEKIHNVSNSYFSIARYYGSVKFNGKNYIYDEAEDTLIREDIFIAERKKTKDIFIAELKKMEEKEFEKSKELDL